MKVLAIRGKNLASLEGDFCIDFTHEPLKSAGIFAITGQTGAGKSTILDALCLALFDDTPRLSKAELIKKDDLEWTEDKISPKDCRNILRRGANEGYAEVDFIALNGDKYRSRWIARRARGKIDGTLQPTLLNLENLSNGREEQGTKKDLLAKITEVVGLTYDQFTRAVLLAQGDFANFLKAKQNEKAELLEKLTGTEIYSEISLLIFQKAKDAANDLELLRQKMKDVRILGEEELASLNQQKNNLEKEVTPLKKVISIIEKKMEWLKQEEQLKNDLINVEKELKALSAGVNQAAPRYEYLAKIDICQEIRDPYNSWINRQVQEETLLLNLKTGEDKLKTISKNEEEVESALKVAQKSVEEITLKYEQAKPDIKQAKELDLKIGYLKEKREEIKNDFLGFRKRYNEAEQHISAFRKQESELKQKNASLTKWFNDNELYKDIVVKIEFVLSLVKSIEVIKKQKINAVNNLESGKKLMHTYVNQLKLQEEELERLNRLLPTEVITLRAKLIDGEPCPVCGSPHHFLDEKVEQKVALDEKNLELAKKSLTEEISRIQANIEKTQKTITEQEVCIRNFQIQYENSYKELKDILSFLPDWEFKLQQNLLQKELGSIANQWNLNKQQLDDSNLQLNNYQVKIEAEQKLQDSISTHLKEKENQGKAYTQLMNEQIAQREKLLDNKSAEEVENYYLELQKKHVEAYEQLRNTKNQIEKNKAAICATIRQLENDCKINKEQLIILDSQIQEWLKGIDQQLSLDALKEIFSRTSEWINQERNELNTLRNQELSLKVTLKEREKQLKAHSESEYRTEESESKELLTRQLQETTEKSELIHNQLTEINVALLTHQKGKEQIKIYEKELSEKADLYENWAKLNELFGSASGNKFKTIAQGYTLDVLLSYANLHLEELTKRYKLQKIPGTLALQVIDNDMLGEVRTVHSLSGGESFLISLSLALGLSSLSSNRMKIESLFIDEGFGALDIDTLSIAMDALDKLQTQGRKIGVISHVEEMKERITTQIQVVKMANGRSIVQVV